MKQKLDTNSQRKIILEAMFENPDRCNWIATDFQQGPYFVGYEASPRMSELKNDYPDLFIVGKIDRFRTLTINWENQEIIDEIKDKYGIA